MSDEEMSDQEINLQSREQEMSDYGFQSPPMPDDRTSDEEISITPAQNTDWRITIEINRQEARNAETREAWSEVCIHRVPRKLRDVNPSAFDPQLVSIGPYHRGKDALTGMDNHKWRCFNQILDVNNQDASLYFDSIAVVVEEAKRCYEGNINLSTYEWVETMVLDGCFLLEILFGFSEDETYFERMGYSKYDPVYSKRGPIEVMKEDMLKLENQLPSFILRRLLGLILNGPLLVQILSGLNGSLRRLVSNACRPGLILNEGVITDLIVTEKVLKLFELEMKPDSSDVRSCSHCLHIYRCGLLRQFQSYPSRTLCCAHRCICVHRWWGLRTRLVGPVHHLCTQIRRCLVGTKVCFSSALASALQLNPAPRPRPHPVPEPKPKPEPKPPLELKPTSMPMHMTMHAPPSPPPRPRHNWGRLKAHRRSTHQQVTIHSATKLREAGVKFKKRETHCFLDIKYEAGVLNIPQLVLDDTIKRQIHNLIAFEQTYHGPDNHQEITSNRHEITSYAVFMDDLIDTSADVAFLHDLGIIDPFAGGSYDDAADFFNQIANGVIFDKEDMYLRPATEALSEKIKDYHNKKIRNWMVGLKRKYFSNPWSIISLIAAIALLVLTFLQTFYAMYGYYRPRN